MWRLLAVFTCELCVHSAWGLQSAGDVVRLCGSCRLAHVAERVPCYVPASQELGRSSGSVNPATRQVACYLMGEFAENSTSDFHQYVPMLIKDLLAKFHDEDPKVLLAATTALEKVAGMI